MGALACLCLLVAAGEARAQTHLFDATLSLEGDCTPTAELDEVVDPGCPYPEGGGPRRFADPNRSASGAGGEIYVVHGPFANEAIEVFDAAGHWVFAETKDALVEPVEDEFPGPVEPKSPFIQDLAVDSQGFLYVLTLGTGPTGTRHSLVVRYTPSTAAPEAGTTYGEPHVLVKGGLDVESLALDELDRLYVVFYNKVDRYKSAAEGNELEPGIGAGILAGATNAAVGPGPEHDIYVSDVDLAVEGTFKSRIRILDGQTGALQETIDGSDTPNCGEVEGEEVCGFSTFNGNLDPAVDRESEELFVSDPESETIYSFRRGGGGEGPYRYLESIQHGFTNNFLRLRLEYDNSPASPNRGYLYTTSHTGSQGHLYAFAPKPAPTAPLVEGQRASAITATEARLRASLNPNATETRWRFEYLPEETWEEEEEAAGPGHGFDKATRAPLPDATLPAAVEPQPVSVAVVGLEPGTIYRFRVAAENCTEEDPERPCETLGEGKAGAEGESARFGTYPAPADFGPCPNEALRAGPSAALPDCRAYELVTPPDTNGLAPIAYTIGVGAPAWGAPLVSPDGQSALFTTEGGSLPGYEGTGGLNFDGYRSQRLAQGWATEAAGPSGVQSQGPEPGGHSADHDCWTWRTFSTDEGSLGPNASYVRHADHSFEPVGLGALGEDPQAVPRFISAGCSHIFFTSKAHLEEDAPPAGTEAIYERQRGGPSEVVSLLPGSVSPGGGQDAAWLGVSADGSAVAFELGGTLYLRRGAGTGSVTEEEALFAGLSQDGRYLFYLRPNPEAPLLEGTGIAQGELFSFDALTEEATQIGSGAETVPVNIPATGAAAYFVSPKQLQAGKGQPGQPNLYGWFLQGGAIRFIATLDPADVSGEEQIEKDTTGGLGLWVSHAVGPIQGKNVGPLADPSRTTPSGDVLLFESAADLSAQGATGEREVYRWEAATGDLACLSCDPTLSKAVGAQLVRLFSEGGALRGVAALPNLSADGRRALFETEAALVPGDVNGALDVYEWRAPGVYGCQRQAGCQALISSGQSAFASHLWGASADGRDVLIRTTELLVGADPDPSPSLYDARIGGGFPEADSPPCEGEACRGAAAAPPQLAAPGSAAFAGPGNVAANPCTRRARRARRLSARARSLRSLARRASRGRAARLRSGARRAARAARQNSRRARRCRAHRRASRRAAR